jgi:hypothetical protein
MSHTHADSHSEHVSHGGHETEDFQGTYAIWAVPFSVIALAVFVAIVALWAPAAASREMRVKEVLGAEESRGQLLEHRAHEKQALASGTMSIEQAMRALETGK